MFCYCDLPWIQAILDISNSDIKKYHLQLKNVENTFSDLFKLQLRISEYLVVKFIFLKKARKPSQPRLRFELDK